MKRLTLYLVFIAIISINAHSQLKETFDSNSWGWTENSASYGKAYIVDGVMRLESKSDKETSIDRVVSEVSSNAYIPIDPLKGFHLKCDALVDKISGKKLFGLILDYFDDYNCVLFVIQDETAFLYKIKEGNIVGFRHVDFKVPGSKKKAKLTIEVKYDIDELEIRVNDIRAMYCKYLPITSNGFGFFAYGKCKVDFDDVEIIR